MLYSSNATLPISILQQLPQQAQDLYREAFNETWPLHAGAYGNNCQGRWLGGITSELLSGG